MSKSKKSKVESLFYNNKFLMVFSVVMAILLWATVKINYSEELTRVFDNYTISTNKVSIPDGMEIFFDGKEPKVEVTVKGKAYNIGEHILDKDDIIVEASGDYVRSADYLVLNIKAKLRDGVTADVAISKVEPSSVEVYVDYKETRTLNVEAKLNNDPETLISQEFPVIKPTASFSTVEVMGPATIINKLSKAYFTAEVDESELPLTQSKELLAEIVYDVERKSDGRFVTCTSVDNELNSPKVIIPLYITAEADTTVSFLNKPGIYGTEMPEYVVNPSKVMVQYDSKGDVISSVNVGQVDFRELANERKVFELPVNDELRAKLADKSIEKFTVTLDMSDKHMITLDKTPGPIVYIGDDNYNYIVNYEKSNLDSISIVGPKEKLEQLNEENVQIKINVSSLDLASDKEQYVEVPDISIITEGFEDCWIYGKYNAYITVEPKG